jgi:predicted porin
MKKILTAFAALSVAGAAFAQSSVTMYGTVDAGIAYYRGEGAGSRLQLISGGNMQTKFGFRGREDLGGGIYAGFELEAGFGADTGLGQASSTNNQPATGAAPAAGTQALTFNRKSFVSLVGPWGDVRLGRDYVPTFWQLFAYDPFRTGVGFGGVTTQGGSPITQLRASNSIGYFTPGCYSFQCKGFFAQAMYALGENSNSAANADDGKVAGIRVGYGGSNWDVSAGQTKTWNAAIGDFTQTVVGGAYENEAFRLMVVGGEHKTGRPVPALNNGTRAPFWQVGAFIYVGPGHIPVAYTRVKRNDAQDSSASKIAIGYVYNLSKRTAIYTTYAHIDNNKAMALPVNVGADAGPTPLPGRSSSGVDLGIRHNF